MRIYDLNGSYLGDARTMEFIALVLVLILAEVCDRYGAST